MRIPESEARTRDRARMVETPDEDRYGSHKSFVTMIVATLSRCQRLMVLKEDDCGWHVLRVCFLLVASLISRKYGVTGIWGALVLGGHATLQRRSVHYPWRCRLCGSLAVV